MIGLANASDPEASRVPIAAESAEFERRMVSNRFSRAHRVARIIFDFYHVAEADPLCRKALIKRRKYVVRRPIFWSGPHYRILRAEPSPDAPRKEVYRLRRSS